MSLLRMQRVLSCSIFLLSFLLSISFLEKNVHADEEVTGVRSLDFGACWVKEEEAGLWKVVSFNDERVFIADAHLLADFEKTLTAQLRAQGLTEFGASRYRVDLHCSSGGHTLLFNIYEGERPLCVWAKVGSQLTITQIASNPDPNGDRYCLGARPGLIFAGIKPQIAMAELPALFQTDAYQQYFEKVEVRDFLKTVDLYLKPQYQYQEQKILQMLQADPTLKKYFDYIETDNYFTFAGETLKLREGQFMGYLSSKALNSK